MGPHKNHPAGWLQRSREVSSCIQSQHERAAGSWGIKPFKRTQMSSGAQDTVNKADQALLPGPPASGEKKSSGEAGVIPEGARMSGW